MKLSLTLKPDSMAIFAGANATWSPADISGLEVMLLADDIVGLANNDPVTTWADSSGNGYNAVQNGADAVPTYVADDGHGVPALRFTAASSQYLTLGNPFSITDTVTTFCVFRAVTDAAGTRQTLFGQENTAAALNIEINSQAVYPVPMRGVIVPTVFLYNAGSTVSTAAATETMTYKRTAAGANHSIRVNGTQLWLVNANTTNSYTGDGTKMLGRRAAGSQHFDGWMHAFLVFNRALTSDEVTLVENYLMKKFQPDQFRLDYLDFAFDAMFAENVQGVAYDGTNYYLSSDKHLKKMTLSGTTFSEVTSRDVTADLESTQTQINGMSYHNGKLWTGGNNTVGATTISAWVQEWNPSTLARISSRQIDAVKGGEGGAWHDVGAGMEYWAIFHTTHDCDRYDSDFNLVASYTLPSLNEYYTTTNLYQGACWAVSGGSHFLLCPTHQAGDTRVMACYKWNGSGFTAWQKLYHPSATEMAQGNHWQVAPMSGNAAYGVPGDVMLFGRRSGSNPGMIRATFNTNALAL